MRKKSPRPPLELSDKTDVKKLNTAELENLSDLLREKIVSVVNDNGGHFSSNLGIIETTVALFKTFDFPKDKLLFDVGHQSYAYKMLSGRYKDFSAIRTKGGLSGFPDAEESEYDTFTVGHAGTSIASALGLCTARDIKGEDYYVIAVVGDGAIVNGLNLEALTSREEKPKKFIVILNDNGMSISKNINGFYRFISRETTKKGYVKGKNVLKKVFGRSFITKGLTSVRDFFKRVLNKGEYFERFGFKYVGVVNGNDVSQTVDILERVKRVSQNKAVFLHLKTQKGNGVSEAEKRSDYYHSVGKNVTERKEKAASLGETLNQLFTAYPDIAAITAGMKDGTGLVPFEKEHSDRFFDVGIAEEYAITFSAGLAKGGLRPVVAVYSTFLQRAYDQLIHDVCLQKLPVVICADRSGLVGEDGKTHQGVFDISFLSHIPEMTVLAPSCKAELKNALEYAFKLNAPVCVRYPKADLISIEPTPFDGTWQTVKNGEDLTVIAVGSVCLSVALDFAKSSTLSVKVISARVVKPLDANALDGIKTPVITVEDNSVIGGFGSLVRNYYAESGKAVKIACLGIKDGFVAHGSVEEQLKDNDITVGNIARLADGLLNNRTEQENTL